MKCKQSCVCSKIIFDFHFFFLFGFEKGGRKKVLNEMFLFVKSTKINYFQSASA